MAHKPTWCCTSIYNLDLEFLKKNNIKYILTDLDNTLAPYNVAVPNEETISFFDYLQKEGFKVFIVSNNTGKRVHTYTEVLKVGCIAGAKKPFITTLRKFLEKNEIDLNECVLIGDQMMTDILCANRLKIKCILTEPLSNEESFLTFFNRKLDNFFRKRYKLSDVEKIDRGVK